MKLNDRQVNALKLLLRSKDVGDGWRIVSKALWPVITPDMPSDLVEKLSSDDGGRVRLTERGKIVCDYI